MFRAAAAVFARSQCQRRRRRPAVLPALELRRIFGEHRLVYRVSGKRREQRLEIVQCRYHY
jgi:hypothetical protein